MVYEQDLKARRWEQNQEKIKLIEEENIRRVKERMEADALRKEQRYNRLYKDVLVGDGF